MNRTRISFLVAAVLLFTSVACQAGKIVCKSGSEGGSADAGRITLAWDSNTETYLEGYRIYYGTSPGKHRDCVDVGKPTEFSPGTTQYVLTGLNRGTTYHIAVRAYSNYGGYFLQSELSNEVSAVAR